MASQWSVMYKIRSCQFIIMSPQHLPDIMSMDDQKLHTELCDSWYKANLNYKNHKKQFKASGKLGYKIMKPIFIIPKWKVKLKQKQKATLL